MKEIDEVKKKRFQFLYKLYELSGSNELVYVGMIALGKELGFDREVSQKIGQYLRGEGLIINRSFGNFDINISITHAGVCEVEDVLSNRDKPTEHFPAYNYIYVEQMTNSQIQQASPGASQVISILENKYDELKEIIKLLNESLNKLGLQQQQLSEMQVEIQTIELQLSSPKPKNTILTESLKSIKCILESVVGSAIATVILNKIMALF